MSDTATPAWRWTVVGLLFVGVAGYMLATGEIGVDKQRTMLITRAAQPGAYWLIVGVSAALGLAALRKAWLRIRS